MSDKRLYVISTLKCNLRCPHCYIEKYDDDFNEELFLEKLNNFDGQLIMFGGECTSDLERMMKIIKSNKEDGKSKIDGVSTNLIVLNDQLIEWYKEIGGIATSWNPSRFHTPCLYQKWLDNLKTLTDNDIGATIMITLTPDLISIPVDDFLIKAKEFDHKKFFFKFEQYLGEDTSKEHFERVDDWLCDLYIKWNLEGTLSFKVMNDKWYYDCDEVYKLTPEGELINRCPHIEDITICEECLTCEFATECRPCRLQKYCSRPRKLMRLIAEDKEKKVGNNKYNCV